MQKLRDSVDSLNSALQAAKVSYFLPNCYCRFITLWSTSLGNAKLFWYQNAAKLLKY